MKSLLYGLILLPLAVTGLTFAKVYRQQIELAEKLKIPLPKIGPPPETDDPSVQKGYQIFNAKGCVFCHGPNGGGEVKNNNAVGGKIPALTHVGEGYSTEELKERIFKGVREILKDDPNGPTPPLYMPSWEGHIAPEEMDALVAYLMSLLPERKEEDSW